MKILKVERNGGMQIIRCRKEDLDYESGKALAICIPDFRGQTTDPERCVIYIEWYNKQLHVRMYDGHHDPEHPSEIINDDSDGIAIRPDPPLTKALYCPKTDLPKLLNSKDPDVLEIIEKRLKGEL